MSNPDSNYSNQRRPYYGNDNHRPRTGGFQNRHEERASAAAESKFSQLTYDSAWIKTGATPQMVSYAEDAGKFMADNKLTNSKIRSIYGEIKRIQMGEFEKEKSSFYLLKPKVAYALGREENNQGLKLFKLVFDRCFADVSDQKSYRNFCNLIEAILAYHKAYGGKD